MAQRLDVLDVSLRITGSPEDAKKLQQSLAPAIAAFSSDFSKSIAKVAKGLGEELTETTKKFSKGFASPDQIKRMEQAFYKGTEPIWKAMEKAAKIDKALQKNISDTKKAQLQKQLADLNTYVQKHNAALKDQFKREVAKDEAVFERKKKLAEDYNDFFAKSFGDQMDDAIESVGKGIGDVMKLNFREALRGGGGLMSKLGAGLQQKGLQKQAAAEAMGGASGGGKMLEMLGGAIGKLGALAAGIGAVVGGVAMLVKVLLDAEAQTREFNREMVNTAGGLSMVGQSGADAEDRLNELRKAAINSTAAIKNLGNISKVIKLGLTAKEYMEVTTKFEEMGVTFDRMRGNAKDLTEATENYTKYVRAAADLSRNFGMSLSEATEKISDAMLDLNLTLGEVKEGFAAIGDAALQSGYGTKRFFNMVLQATSGVTMYNVRLGATGKLLQNLVRVLGMKTGGEMLKDLSGKLQGESYEDRYKRILMTGSKVTGQVIGREAERQAAGVSRGLTGKAFDLGDVTAGGKSALSAAAAGNVKQLAQVTDKDRASLISALSKQDEAMARRLDNLIDLARGTSGKIGDQAKALERLGPGGAIVMELNRVKSVLGKSLDELGGVNAMAFQKMTGLSSEQVDYLQKVSRTVVGDFENAKAMAAKVKGDKVQEAMYNESIKKTGMYIKDGNVLSREDNKKIQDANDALQEWSQETHEQDMKVMTEQEKNSERIAENTYDLANLYSQSMIAILEEIAEVSNKILVFLGLKDDTSKLKAAGAAEMQDIEKQQGEVKKQSEATQAILKDLREKRKETGADVKTIDVAIKKAEETQAALKAQQADLAQRKSSARGLVSGKDDQSNAFFMQAKGAGLSDEEAARVTVQTGAGGAAALEKAQTDALSNMRYENSLEVKRLEEKKKKGGLTDIEGMRMGFLTNPEQVAAREAALKTSTTQGFFKNLGKSPSGTAQEGVESLDPLTKESYKFEKGQWVKQGTVQEKMKKATESSLKELQELNSQIKKANEADERSNIIGALKSAGVADEALAPLIGAPDAATFNKLLAGFEATEGNAAALEKAGIKGRRLKVETPVQDAILTADGRIIPTSKGDGIAVLNEEAMRRGGGRGAGSANVVFHIHATEGREDVVTDKVVAGLHQVYSVLTGDAATVGV